MEYTVYLKPRALKDLESLPARSAARIINALERLKNDMCGDVKKLTNHYPEYRLRVGPFRILFEVVGQKDIYIYRVILRDKAYH